LRRDGRVLEKAEVDLFKDKIVEMYAEGRLLKDIIAETGIAASTISDWRNKDTVFDASCIGAQNIGFELHADNLLTIPDEYEDVNKARLKSENIKWHLSKRASHRYGDRMVLDINNTIDLKGALVDAQHRLILSKLLMSLHNCNQAQQILNLLLKLTPMQFHLRTS